MTTIRTSESVRVSEACVIFRLFPGLAAFPGTPQSSSNQKHAPKKKDGFRSQDMPVNRARAFRRQLEGPQPRWEQGTALSVWRARLTEALVRRDGRPTNAVGAALLQAGALHDVWFNERESVFEAWVRADRFRTDSLPDLEWVRYVKWCLDLMTAHFERLETHGPEPFGGYDSDQSGSFDSNEGWGDLTEALENMMADVVRWAYKETYDLHLRVTGRTLVRGRLNTILSLNARSSANGNIGALSRLPDDVLRRIRNRLS